METATTQPLLECLGISKHFGGSLALADVNFTLYPGEVHGLVGTNGAGKSTLMKILAGVLSDHQGQIHLEGKPVILNSPQASRTAGIAMVYQELSGIGQLSVAENLFLGRQLQTRWGTIHWGRMYQQAWQYLEEMAIDIDVRQRLDSYPLVVRQMVEILRGVHTGARILILDEPTSALSPPEAKRLFELIRKLQSDGVSIIFISHFIEDVLAICDRLTILRDGKKLETRTCSETNKHYVIQAMLGHSIDSQEVGYETDVRLPPRISGDVRLQVENLTLANQFRDISLQVHAGECVGIYGFVGAGHQELAHTIAGAFRPTTGQVSIDDLPLTPGRVDHAVRQGAVLVAADRGKTLVQETEVYKNVTLSHLRDVVGSWLTRGKELRATLPVLKQVGCRPADPLMRVSSLSGGNQQKVVLGKWLLGEVKVLVLEEPTRGMDVGAKDEVMRLVGQLKANGAAVLLISTEPELVLQHADRIIVMSRGKITQEFVDQPVDKTSLTDAC